jgi:hypothetical protein
VGLLRSVIRDDNPVLFFEQTRLYGVTSVVDGEIVPLGVARVAREGADVTIVSAMNGVHESLKAGELGGRARRPRRRVAARDRRRTRCRTRRNSRTHSCRAPGGSRRRARTV